ncbi:MAG: hypothetical protein PHN95_00475 [Candidatus Pacebacteria bacterium]|nr:hypothetical protein [Candidatus Paceibacterota bacterium]MDD4998901.1 hypothetical protein [Candidatus Paceibacterota bacterium]
MKFKFIISKWGNFYFFVQNLSEWHFSCRKNYNVLWQKELGILSPKEKKALKVFKKIRSNFPSGKTFFEQAFFTKKNPWNDIKKNLPTQHYEAIKNTFLVLNDKFEKLYKEDYPSLKFWQENLKKTNDKKSPFKDITEILCLLYKNYRITKKTINVYLLFSSTDQRGGGANIDEKSISIEISRQPLTAINYIIGIIWHETIHLCFEKEYFLPLVQKKFPGDWDTIFFIKEMTVISLFPKGLLANKFLKVNKNKKESLHLKLPIKYNEWLLSITNSYIKKRKHFDENYIEKLYTIISKLDKKLK